jgi:iron(III) transport system substrate-binding protein
VNSTKSPKKFCSRRKKFEHGAARLPGSEGDTSMSGSKLSIKELAQLRGDERKETLIRGATEEGKLNFYTSTAPEDIQSLLMAFEMRFPFIRSEMVRDKGVAIRERIIDEYRNGGSAADVVEVNDINLGKLKERGLLCPYYSPEGEVYPRELHESDGFWVAEQKNYLVLAWNPRLVGNTTVPSDYRGLLDPSLKGKITVEAQIAAGSVILSPNIHSNNSEWLKRRGLPIDWRPLEPVEVEFVGAGLTVAAPHPHTALLLIDYILSLEGQKIYRQWKRVPCHPAVEPDPPYMSQGFQSIILDARAFLKREAEYEKIWRELILEPAGCFQEAHRQ